MKFFNLLQKELKELINAQMIMGFVLVMVLFFVLSNVMTDSISEAVKQEYNITLSDQDNTEFTDNMLSELEEKGTHIRRITTDGDDYSAFLKDNDLKGLVIIPKGFTDSIEAGEKPELISIMSMKSASMMTNLNTENSGTIELIRQYVSEKYSSSRGLTEEDIKIMAKPITVAEKTVVNNKWADVSASSVAGRIMLQSAILPIIIFILIIMTSQMLVNAIATEKIDKTLETLLSAPVSRTAIIGAKMLAAAIVAMLQAIVYTVGFSGLMAKSMFSVSGDVMSNMNNMSDEVTNAVTEATGSLMSVSEGMARLGLSLSIADYLLVGVQLFLTILICLSVSIMLGALVNDSKSSQTIMLPLMMAAMIPYFISLFADVNSMPTALKVLIYAIPFTHTFTAMPNLMFGHNGIFWFGIIYQLVFFLVCMFFALKLFNSDKILTVSLNFGQKSKFKKNQKQYTDE